MRSITEWNVVEIRHCVIRRWCFLYLVEEKEKHPPSQSDLQLLHATGRVPLLIRIICLSFLVFCSWVLVGTVSYFITGEDLGIHLKESPHLGLWSVAGILALVLLITLFIGVWFWQNWIYLDPASRGLVFKHRGIFGISWRRLNAVDAAYVAIKRTGVLSSSWEVLLVFGDGRTERLTSTGGEQFVQDVADRIAAAINKPLRMPETARKAVQNERSKQ